MAVTKADIVQSIMDQIGFTKNQSSEVTETLLEVIKPTLASGEDVLVSGFGKFCVNEKAERRGRNPARNVKGLGESSPPLPWFNLNAMKASDLRSIYQFVRFLGPGGKSAPNYLPPDKEPLGPHAIFPAPPQ